MNASSPLPLSEEEILLRALLGCRDFFWIYGGSDEEQGKGKIRPFPTASWIFFGALCVWIYIRGLFTIFQRQKHTMLTEKNNSISSTYYRGGS